MLHLMARNRHRGLAAALGWGVLMPVVAAIIAAAAAPAAQAAGFPLAIERQLPLAAGAQPSALAIATDGSAAYLAQGDALTAYATATRAPQGVLHLPGRIVALAIAPAGDRAYAALGGGDGRGAGVAVVSLRPLGLLKTLPLSAAPSDLALDPEGASLYVESAAAGRLFAFDAASGRLRASGAVPGRLRQIAANGYGGVFVAVADRDLVAVLDAASLRPTGEFPLPDCARPSGLALDPVGRRLFVACADGGTAVVDTDVGFTFERLAGARAGDARGVYARPTGALGWKGAAFFAGTRATVNAVRMLAFIHYADGGALRLPAAATALAFDAARGELWITLAPAAGDAQAAGSLLVLGPATAAATGVHP
ncbi:MAG: hypothetical protein KGL92_13655 [Gammaproteobacteria bacterium]|nr:hypothetical protein [Gammaproteobacteria bacterium]